MLVASSNVIAYVTPVDVYDTECDYDPYGKMRVGDTTPAPNQSQLDMEYNPVTNNTAFADLMGMDTGWFDRESGLYLFGHRHYDHRLGRWLQRDPNGTGLVYSTSQHYFGQSPSAFVDVNPRSQYSDGLSLYQFVGSNPVTGFDPLGLFTADFDWMSETESLETDWYGHRLYALGAINEGARWASLGLQTTLDIAGSLLGIDVFQSVSVLASGRGGFWDSMNIVMAAAPLGRFVKIADMVHDAAAFARRARGAVIAIEKANNLATLARRVDRNSEGFRHAVRDAERLYPKLAGKVHKHHVVPMYLGGPVDGPIIEVNVAYHKLITNEFRRKHAYGLKDKPTQEKLIQWLKEVYDKYPLPE